MKYERYSIELSPSGRAVCRKCNHLIKTGTLRLRKNIGIEFSHYNFRFFCRNCAKEKLKEEVFKLEKLLMEIKRWS